MIGGTDIVIPWRGDPAVLKECVHIIQQHWPQARFENALTGEKCPSYADVALGAVRELLAYRDASSEALWDADGAYASANTMIYLILSSDCLTVVLDDPNTEEMRSLLEALRKTLQMETDGKATPSPTAAAETTPRTKTC
jgi:hypothetical protein